MFESPISSYTLVRVMASVYLYPPSHIPLDVKNGVVRKARIPALTNLRSASYKGCADVFAKEAKRLTPTPGVEVVVASV